MTLANRNRNPRPVKPSDVTKLGRVRGLEYVTVDSGEYTVGKPYEPGTVTLRPGELDLVEQVQTVIDGTQFTGPQHRKLSPVRPGSFASLDAKGTAHAARVTDATRPRPIDLLVPLSPFRRQFAFGTWRVAPEPTLDGALTYLADVGAVLRVTASGSLRVDAPPARSAAVVELCTVVEQLIVGALTGQRVRCEASGHDGHPPEATTILAVDIAACADCARGDATAYR